MTLLHLVRHAAHGLLGRVLTGRMPGVALSQAGLAQAEQLAATLAARPIAAVLTSPVQRARATAEPIAARLGLPAQVERGLDEIDFGRWTGMDFAALEHDPDWHAWNRFRSTARCPGGEGMLAAQARAVAAMCDCAAAHPGREIVLVSHQDVLKALLAHALGLPLDHLHRLALEPAHRAVIRLYGDGVVVEAINLPPA